MAGFRVRIEGTQAVLTGLKKMNPEANSRIVEPALVESVQLTLRIAAQQKIKRGGRRGAPPVPKILTSRTGRLRASLSGSQSIDRSGLPRFVEGGSNLVYAPVHEFPPNARPYLSPALADAEKQFEDIFLKWWRRQLP